MRSTSTTSTRTFITPPSAPEPQPKRKRILPTSLAGVKTPWIIVIVLVLVIVFLAVQYETARHKLQTASSPSTANQQVTSLLSKVSKVAVLPSGETPTVASVVHANQLKNQAFFAQAKDGDKVLIYAKAKEAILYRPSTNQIVTIAPVTSNANGTTTLGSQ